MSPVAAPPRAIYRPSSPEGSEKDTSYQASFVDLEKTEHKSNRTRTLRDKKRVATVTRSSPYGAEADEDDGWAAKGEKHDVLKKEKKEGDKNERDDRKSSKRTSKGRRSTVEPAEGVADGKANSRKNSGGLELNNSTLAALKYCNSSEGSKLSEMSSKELKSLSKTLARANIDDAQEIYNVLVNFISNKMIASKDVTETSQRFSDVFESTGTRKMSGGQGLEPQEGDAMTFYHSDTSCEVSPTDPKFRTISSISSPPLDSSSPKSSGSSIGVQTDSHGVSTIPTTLTTVASSGSKGLPVGATFTDPAHSSSQVAGQYGGSEKITPTSNSSGAGFNSIPPTQYGSTVPVSVQTAGTTSSGVFTTSPVLSTQYVAITSHTTPTGHPNVIPPTSASRTLTPEEQNNPPSRAYNRTQSTTSSVPTQRHVYEADSRPFGYSEPRIVHHLGRATYPPGVPRHPGYQTAQMTTTDKPSTMQRCPVETLGNVVNQPYHLVGAVHANIDPSHVNPLSSNVVPASYVQARSNNPNFATNQGIPIQGYASAVPNREIPGQGHPFRRNDQAISDLKHEVVVSNHAVFKPLQTGQSNNAIPASRQGSSSYPIPQTSGNILAQSCPVFTGRQLTSPDSYPGCALKPVQLNAGIAAERARTFSSSQSAAYQNRALKETGVPHGTQNAFYYQDVGPDQFHAISDVHNEHGRHPRDWVASGHRQVR